MASSAYLMLKGQKQGEIQGSVAHKGSEGAILVHGFQNAIVTPRDPSSGQPTGKRQHQPIVIIKEIDKSSPRLWSALVSNENLTLWVLNVWTPSTGAAPGIDKNVYRVELTNANIASIEETMADNSITASASVPVHERVTFTYQKITWTWLEGAITATDDWNATV